MKNSLLESEGFDLFENISNSTKERFRKNAQSKEAAIYSSAVNLSKGDILLGCIDSVVDGVARIDVGGKEAVYLDKSEIHYLDGLKIGQEIRICISEVNIDRTERRLYPIKGSVEDAIRSDNKALLIEGISERSIFEAVVVKSIPNAGLSVKIEGVECFLPGSLAGINRVSNFDSFVGKTIMVVPTGKSDDGKIVVSHKTYLESLIPEAISRIAYGEVKDGVVTGTTDFAVFVEFDTCLTGMIHKTALDPEFAKRLENKDLKGGDPVWFYVKEIVNDKKIILSQKKNEFWDSIGEYALRKQSFEGKVIQVKQNEGYLVLLEDGSTKGILPYKETDKYSINSPLTVYVKEFNKKGRKIVFGIGNEKAASNKRKKGEGRA